MGFTLNSCLRNHFQHILCAYSGYPLPYWYQQQNKKFYRQKSLMLMSDQLLLQSLKSQKLVLSRMGFLKKCRFCLSTNKSNAIRWRNLNTMLLLQYLDEHMKLHLHKYQYLFQSYRFMKEPQLYYPIN